MFGCVRVRVVFRRLSSGDDERRWNNCLDTQFCRHFDLFLVTAKSPFHPHTPENTFIFLTPPPSSALLTSIPACRWSYIEFSTIAQRLIKTSEPNPTHERNRRRDGRRAAQVKCLRVDVAIAQRGLAGRGLIRVRHPGRPVGRRDEWTDG